MTSRRFGVIGALLTSASLSLVVGPAPAIAATAAPAPAIAAVDFTGIVTLSNC